MKAFLDWIKNNWKLAIALALLPFGVGIVILLLSAVRKQRTFSSNIIEEQKEEVKNEQEQKIEAINQEAQSWKDQIKNKFGE